MMSYNGKEIITFAFGHYSCYVAAHFFNIQEAIFSYNPSFFTGINHDVLFRDGLNAWRKQIFTPRLIVLDEAKALRCLSKEGYYKEIDKIQAEIEEQSKDTEQEVFQPTFDDQNEFIKDILREKYRLRDENYSSGKYLLKSNYLLQNAVVSWSDYLVTEFNNRTIITMPRNSSYFESNELFNSFDAGLLVWHKTNVNELIEDNIRKYMEEVDNLQGFQMLFDGNNGYTGVASACLEHLRDEYSKKVIVSVPNIYSNESCYNPNVYNQFCEQIFSIASSVSSLSEHSDVVTLLSHIKNPWGRKPSIRAFNRLNLTTNSDMYHASSMLASAIDLFTLPPRVQDSGLNMNTFYSNLNSYGRKYLSVGLCFPFPMSKDDSVNSVLSSWNGDFFDSLTPLVDINPSQIDIQCISSKGIKDNYSSSDDYSSIKRLLSNFFSRIYPSTITGVVLAKPGFRVPRTFPADIFYNKSEAASQDNEYLPLVEYSGLAGLHNSKEMGSAINDLYEEVKKLNNKGMARKLYDGSEMTDYQELFDNLKNLSQVYDVSDFI